MLQYSSKEIELSFAHLFASIDESISNLLNTFFTITRKFLFWMALTNIFFIYPTVVISLLFFIYLVPGIALFPKFIQSPRTAATIPFISVSIVLIVSDTAKIIIITDKNPV